jgi:TetR/AcrR family transcriptional regulator, mexJK operon transcriptional repressor
MNFVASDVASGTYEKVLPAAMEVFLEDGYRASMEKIAARAQVAKQTLYNNFPNKDALFGEVIHYAIRNIPLPVAGGGGDLREQLLKFAIAFRRLILSREGLELHRIVISEAPRFPELAKAFHKGGPEKVHNAVVAFLSEAMESGLLRRDDPEFAADVLCNLMMIDRARRLCGCNSPSGQYASSEKSERIVDSFLRAFSPDAVKRKES